MVENDVITPHKLRRKDRAAHIWLDKGDHIILKLYKRILKSTMTAALHYMIGIATRCFEEKHLQTIADLEERTRIQARIIVKYIEKYGQLRV